MRTLAGARLPAQRRVDEIDLALRSCGLETRPCWRARSPPAGSARDRFPAHRREARCAKDRRACRARSPGIIRVPATTGLSVTTPSTGARIGNAPRGFAGAAQARDFFLRHIERAQPLQGRRAERATAVARRHMSCQQIFFFGADQERRIEPGQHLALFTASPVAATSSCSIQPSTFVVTTARRRSSKASVPVARTVRATARAFRPVPCARRATATGRARRVTMPGSGFALIDGDVIHPHRILFRHR